MGERQWHAHRALRVLESVRCLDCGGVYAKPAGGGTAVSNPGCPDCGYLGWLGLSRAEESSRLRFAADLRPRRFA
jgi:predicted  nucleic acid-binding Zn-ribbon protein